MFWRRNLIPLITIPDRWQRHGTARKKTHPFGASVCLHSRRKICASIYRQQYKCTTHVNLPTQPWMSVQASCWCLNGPSEQYIETHTHPCSIFEIPRPPFSSSKCSPERHASRQTYFGLLYSINITASGIIEIQRAEQSPHGKQNYMVTVSTTYGETTKETTTYRVSETSCYSSFFLPRNPSHQIFFSRHKTPTASSCLLIGVIYMLIFWRNFIASSNYATKHEKKWNAGAGYIYAENMGL